MESHSSSHFSVSQDSGTQIPKVGQKFESYAEAYAFYNRYARAVGFSVWIADSKNTKETNQTRRSLFVCSKEGKMNTTNQRKHKASKRKCTPIGCNARLSVVKQQTGEGWVVSKFVEEHNHSFTNPSNEHNHAEENIPTREQLQSTDIDASGPSSVRRDENDALEEERAHDTETLIEFFFPTEKEKSLSFFYDYEIDSDNKLIRCLWADPESRRSYSVFGDVMELHTFYFTNMYSMIFVTFSGANHHGQTIVFACGLLSGVSIESFVWLFSKFIEAMPNRAHPGVIITDHEDTVIPNAVSKVLPFTFHRYFLRRILNCFSAKFNGMLYAQQYRHLVNIIHQSQSPEEFEHRWNQVMESTTNLRRDKWLSRMYSTRSQWVPAYVKRVFRAGICNMQISDGDLPFFKERVNVNDTLMGLVTHFNRALAHQRHLELIANQVDLSEPSMERCNLFVMEKQMAKIYTRRIFLLFHKEFELSCDHICGHKISSSIDAKVYRIKRFEPEQGTNQNFLVTHNLTTDWISCSCRTFEFFGFPCCHMLCYV